MTHIPSHSPNPSWSSFRCACVPLATRPTSTSTSDSTQKGTRPTDATTAARWDRKPFIFERFHFLIYIFICLSHLECKS